MRYNMLLSSAVIYLLCNFGNIDSYWVELNYL